MRLSSIPRRLRYPGRLLWSETPTAAAIYFTVAAALAREEYKRRLALTPRSQLVIPPDRGYLLHDYSGNASVMEGIQHGRRLAEAIDWRDRGSRSKKPFLLTAPLTLDSTIRALALELVKPAGQYMGALPVLQNAAIWYSPNSESHPGRSQDFHMDGGGMRQVKCFIPLDEITRDAGPLTILPADVTERVYAALVAKGVVVNRTSKVPDLDIEPLFSPSERVEILGKIGTVGFVDTCRCYHFGSRKAARPRLLMMLQFQSAFSRDMPVWGRRFEPFEDEADALLFGAAALMYGARTQSLPSMN